MDLTQLQAGDVIEVRQPNTLLLYQGVVDHVFPEQGVLWIRCGPLQERKLLDASEFQLCRHPVFQA